MDKLKVIQCVWGCVSVVFIAMFIASSYLETIKIYKLTNGSTISLEIGGFAEVALILAAYFISKLIIESE